MKQDFINRATELGHVLLLSAIGELVEGVKVGHHSDVFDDLEFLATTLFSSINGNEGCLDLDRAFSTAQRGLTSYLTTGEVF